MTQTTHSEIPFTSPMECLTVAGLPDTPDWVYELKLDGFRGQGIRDKRGIHLLSKNGKDFSKRFPQVCAALKEALQLGTAVDGELVAFDETGQGRPRSRCSIKSQAVGDSSRVLALDEAQDLPVSRYGEELVRR